MEHCNPVKFPMEKGLVFPESSCDANQPYRELLGSMMYIMLCVRPDICYAVGQMGRYQQRPTDSNWQALKKIVRYLKGTKSLQLKFCRKPNALPLIGYADADWASDSADRKSISGYLYKVYGCTVSWASRKQQTVALSSSEAEYVALSAAASEGIWLKGILEDLGVLKTDELFTLYEDNHGCIAMANNTECKRAKHIDIKHHFLRDHVIAGTFRVEPVGTNGQLADIFTKALEAGRFREMRSLIGLTD